MSQTLSAAPAVAAKLRAPQFLKAGAGWLIPAALVAVWQALSSFGLLSEGVLPSPLAVLQAGWRLTLSGELPRNAWVGLLRALAGLAVGGGIGFALGLANGLSRISESLTDSTLQMVRNVPHLALIPLVILWFASRSKPNCSSWRSACSFPSTPTRCTACARSIRS